ncbi:Translin-associated factor X-interacting protein 1 [Trypanosoma melophagium]|uniref:Translin-associated factor X-interacting protein 1 n=1 Tax=Trypanosoma melophagium TaxID=715481 RepID=UPI00351AA3AF|nr:Translin-associated factor X-interacting protein 1 [Trypanosoma melophagium]
MPPKSSVFGDDERPRDRQSGVGAPSLSLVPVNNAAAKVVAHKVLPPLKKGPSFPLAVWPSRQKRVVCGSKAPLAVQLEAFVRREHRLYVQEHRDCTHSDTLHIVREAFSVITEHFLEYREILSFIRDEYEATFEEIAEELKRLRAIKLENESDRSLHVMELLRQRESFTTIISNQQAQLQATQGLIHSLREQVATYEQSNKTLMASLEVKKKECEEAVERAKMISNAMIEESARNARFIAIHNADVREIGRLDAQVTSLKDKLEDADKRFNALVRQMMFGNTRPTNWRSTGKEVTPQVSTDSDEPTNNERNDTSQSVAALQRRIDDLLFDYERLKEQTSGVKKESISESDARPKENTVTEEKDVNVSKDIALTTSSKLIQSWLKEENLTERELDALDYLLPPGIWDEDPLGFLKVCRPVRNLHLRKKDVVSMLCSFWRDRQFNRQVLLKHYFLEWIRAKAGTDKSADEISMNVLYVCQRNPDDPDCRGMMLTLRSFLPEDMIISWQKDINELEEACRDCSHVVNGTIDAPFIVNALRIVMPEKRYVHILQLRLYLWRLSKESERIPIDTLFSKDSHFVWMLKKQFLLEVEEFTLQVVEKVRLASSDSKTIRVQDITGTIAALDGGIPKGTLHRLVAEATQLSAMEVATADASFTVKLQPVLQRFRSSVLLRRATPPDGEGADANPFAAESTE